jgi:hypothetical protein
MYQQAALAQSFYPLNDELALKQLKLTHRARVCVRDQHLLQFRVVSGQKPAAFRSSAASAQAFRKFDLYFGVHVTIKILPSIPRG